MGETLGWVSGQNWASPLPIAFSTRGSLRCLRWYVDLVIISKISALKTYRRAAFLPNLTVLPSHLVCLRAVATFCGMMLGQRQTLYALAFLTDHSGAMDLLLPSSFTVPFPHSFFPFLFLR